MAEGNDISTDDPGHELVTAAILVIGDEILSGRTADKNINTIALKCTDVGIRLSEVRVVPDDELRIVEALNYLRGAFSYVFTTGGIGPTHDDITALSVAKAFDVALLEHPEALSVLEAHYPAGELSEARRLMARVPAGGVLIENSISAAPGFMIENVIVMAGVPAIVEVMLDDVVPRLKTGRVLLSRTVKVLHPESFVSGILAGLACDFPALSIGSYPYFRDGVVGTTVVMRGVDEDELVEVGKRLQGELEAAGRRFEVEDIK